MISKRALALVFTLLTIIIITILLKAFIFGKVIDTNQIYFTKIEVSPYLLNLEGGTSNSAMVFSGYNFEAKDGAGYVELKYSLAGFLNSDGNFIISDGIYLEYIDKLYLTDKKGEKKLIWDKPK